MFYVRNYPLVVDPAANAIEVHTAEHDGGRERVRHHQLGRIVPVSEDLPFTQTTAQAHIFGDGVTIKSSKFFLTYDPAGRVTQLFTLAADKEWIGQDIPPEQSGAADTFPSVRFVFLNDNDRRQFMRLLALMGDKIKRTEPPSPRDMAEALLILGRSPEVPRQINVEKLNEQHQPGAA